MTGMRVLLAFDGSAGATEAATLAEAIPWPHDTRVRIVSAVELTAWIASLPRAPMTASPVLEAELIAYLEEQQAELIKRFAHVGSAESVIHRGRAASAIIDDARDFAADVVIVGSRGHGPVASLLLGSVSAEVVDQAPCPVLVARRASLRRVVFATDGSPSARAAEDRMATWPIFDGLHVDVVSVADTVRPWSSGIAPMFQRRARDAHAQELQLAAEAAEQVTSEVTQRLRDAGREAGSTVRRGDPAAEVIAFAEERDADLIVLGSRGRSALAEIVLGSVARNVVSSSKASVLVVREADAGRQTGPVS